MVAWVIPAEEEKGHSLLSPSSSKRWMNCPAAPYLCQGVKEEPKEYTEEGTAAHWVGEQRLTGGANVQLGDTVTTPVGMTFEVTEEMLDAVEVYGQAVTDAEAELDAKAEIEKHLVLIEGLIEGTGDCVVVGDNEGKINDFKYGQGVDVDAEDNSQLSIYALGAFRGLGFTPDAEIEIQATQPRHFKDGAVRSWIITWGHLETWFDWTLMPAVDRVQAATIEGPYNYGPHCAESFCPALAAGICPAVNEANKPVEMMLMDNVMTDLPAEISEFSAEQLAKALELEAGYKLWVKAADAKFAEIKKRALGLASEGYTVPGFKRVAGRKGAAKWTDEAKAVELAKDHDVDPYEEKMLTPAKLRDAFKAEGLDAAPLMELTECSQGEALVPESSKKKALPPKVEVEELYKDVPVK